MRIGRSILIWVILLSLPLLPGCDGRDGSSRKESYKIAEVGKKAPDMSLSGVDGKAFSLEDYRGSIIILNFWATWCPPCIKEIPLLESTFNEYKERGVIVIGVNYNEDREVVVNFIRKAGITFPVALDENLELTRRYGVLSLPATFFIDRDGILYDKYRGELNENLLKGKLLPLLSEAEHTRGGN